MREVIGAVERVDGAARAVDARRRGGRAIPAVLYAAPQKAQTELHWKPRLADLDSIVRHGLGLAPDASARISSSTAHP